MEEFSKNKENLNKKGAFQKWLSFYDRIWQIPHTMGYLSSYMEMEYHLKTLIAALPHPELWNDLLNEAKNREEEENYPQYILMYIAYFLNGNDKGMASTIKNMENRLKIFSETERESVKTVIQDLANQLRNVTGTIDEKLKHFLKSLEEDKGYSNEIRIIDLVTIVGEEKASMILKDILTGLNKNVTIPKGTETLKLARAIALEHVDDLKRAQWKLAHSVETMELYEAMSKKFSDQKMTLGEHLSDSLMEFATNSSSYYANEDKSNEAVAKLYYMVGIIIANRPDEAKTIAQELGITSDAKVKYEISSQLKQAGFTREIYRFLTELLKEEPLSNMWEYYIPIAVEAGESESIISWLNEYLKIENIDPEVKMKLTKFLYAAYLSLDHFDEAGQLIRSVKLDMKSLFSRSKKSSYLKHIAEMAAAQVNAGHLMDKKDWIDHGIKLYQECLKLKSSGPDTWEYETFSGLALGKLFMNMDKNEQAEELVNQFIIDYLKQNRDLKYYDTKLHDAGQVLLDIYHKDNRSDDILALVDDYPYFSVEDVRGFISSDRGFISRDEAVTNPAYIVANAFYQKGDEAQALKITKEILLHLNGHDPSYELVVKILGDDKALEYLDLQHKRDQFEERPLIFKAEILLKQKKIDEALSVIQQAIAIDPSDGEQGKGSRMRAYKVLSDVMDAKGDKEKVAFYNNVVSAIRASEEADDYYSKGLVMSALTIYKNSLNTFEDAYCIQSRIAVQLESVGRFDEAEKHFLKAYELMPSSFGRRESHCFGCELVFATDRRQKIAEKVFKNLLEKEPDNPKVHYLLGYLHFEKGDVGEAHKLFKKATDLDPLYTSAWKKRQELMKSVMMSKEESDDIILNNIKLDPKFKTFDLSQHTVWDVKKLWGILSESNELYPDLDEDLYVLQASKIRINEHEDTRRYHDYYSQKKNEREKLLTDHSLLSPLYSLEYMLSI